MLQGFLVVTKEVPRSRGAPGAPGALKEVIKMFCQRDYKVRTEDVFFNDF